jgi:hypothetical protein
MYWLHFLFGTTVTKLDPLEFDGDCPKCDSTTLIGREKITTTSLFYLITFDTKRSSLVSCPKCRRTFNSKLDFEQLLRLEPHEVGHVLRRRFSWWVRALSLPAIAIAVVALLFIALLIASLLYRRG